MHHLSTDTLTRLIQSTIQFYLMIRGRMCLSGNSRKLALSIGHSVTREVHSNDQSRERLCQFISTSSSSKVDIFVEKDLGTKFNYIECLNQIPPKPFSAPVGTSPNHSIFVHRFSVFEIQSCL